MPNLVKLKGNIIQPKFKDMMPHLPHIKSLIPSPKDLPFLIHRKIILINKIITKLMHHHPLATVLQTPL
jgi:hypothetical protein